MMMIKVGLLQRSIFAHLRIYDFLEGVILEFLKSAPPKLFFFSRFCYEPFSPS